MNEIIKILMERDGMSRSQAVDMVNETASLIFEAIDSGDDPEEVLADMPGLEAGSACVPDYIDAFIF